MHILKFSVQNLISTVTTQFNKQSTQASKQTTQSTKGKTHESTQPKYNTVNDQGMKQVMQEAQHQTLPYPNGEMAQQQQQALLQQHPQQIMQTSNVLSGHEMIQPNHPQIIQQAQEQAIQNMGLHLPQQMHSHLTNQRYNQPMNQPQFEGVQANTEIANYSRGPTAQVNLQSTAVPPNNALLEYPKQMSISTHQYIENILKTRQNRQTPILQPNVNLPRNKLAVHAVQPTPQLNNEDEEREIREAVEAIEAMEAENYYEVPDDPSPPATPDEPSPPAIPDETEELRTTLNLSQEEIARQVQLYRQIVEENTSRGVNLDENDEDTSDSDDDFSTSEEDNEELLTPVNSPERIQPLEVIDVERQVTPQKVSDENRKEFREENRQQVREGNRQVIQEDRQQIIEDNRQQVREENRQVIQESRQQLIQENIQKVTQENMHQVRQHNRQDSGQKPMEEGSREMQHNDPIDKQIAYSFLSSLGSSSTTPLSLSFMDEMGKCLEERKRMDEVPAPRIFAESGRPITTTDLMKTPVTELEKKDEKSVVYIEQMTTTPKRSLPIEDKENDERKKMKSTMNIPEIQQQGTIEKRTLREILQINEQPTNRAMTNPVEERETMMTTPSKEKDDSCFKFPMPPEDWLRQKRQQQKAQIGKLFSYKLPVIK